VRDGKENKAKGVAEKGKRMLSETKPKETLFIEVYKNKTISYISYYLRLLGSLPKRHLFLQEVSTKSKSIELLSASINLILD